MFGIEWTLRDYDASVQIQPLLVSLKRHKNHQNLLHNSYSVTLNLKNYALWVIGGRLKTFETFPCKVILLHNLRFFLNKTTFSLVIIISQFISVMKQYILKETELKGYFKNAECFSFAV